MRRWPLLLLIACATPRTPEGERQLTRDAIHWRLVQCMKRADLDAAAHGRNAMAEVFCQREAELDCKAAHLEPMCGQWEWGGT